MLAGLRFNPPFGKIEKVRKQRFRPSDDLRAHRLGAIRGVRAHVLSERSARQVYSAGMAIKAGKGSLLSLDRLGTGLDGPQHPRGRLSFGDGSGQVLNIPSQW